MVVDVEMRARPSYPIDSVDNALRLLLMFEGGKSVRIADASRSIGVARSTAHRLMQMLQYYGLIEQDKESKAYVAGPTLVELGLSVVRELDIRVAARAELEALAHRMDETVHLVELHGREVVFLDSVESTRVLRVGGRTGAVIPAHATSSGKALLATLSEERLRELYPRERLPEVTGATISSRRQLEAQLEQIRRDGYAAAFAESEEDVSAIGVAVIDRRGAARAAVAISVPRLRMTPDYGSRLADAAMEAARRIAANLP